MQLSKQVSFLKTMGDPTRLKIINLLSVGPLHVGAIAGKLGLTAPTISHHLNKLKDCAIVFSRRDKNTIYYHLNKKVLKHHANVLLQYATETEKGEDSMKQDYLLDKQKVITNFFTKDGKMKTIPSQQKKKLLALEYLIEGLSVGVKYPEKEINNYIQQFHEDFATIRREFIIHHFMFREDGVYEVNPKEMWASTKFYQTV